MGYPPFGALAELTGDDAALTVAVDAFRSPAGPGTGAQVFGPTDGRALVVAPDDAALADALASAVPGARAHGRLRAHVDPPRV